ncbi:MAG TPA: GspE/PulE family protein, partial [Candidatus Acidoferrales bacterium]|nr:GspE/PulE family protein [Candidatus Acidoferrales bacterium]
DVERFLKGQGPQIDLLADITPFLNALRDRLREQGVGKEAPTENKVAQAVQLMIHLAVKMHASELHLEPQSHQLVSLRYRLDGVLKPIVDLDLRLLPAIIQQWKTLAACNVRETARPQEGRIVVDIAAGGGKTDLRVMFLPTLLGEALSAFLLDPGAARLTLEQLNYSAPVMKRLFRWLDSPSGLVVFTGPAGCGKTSALYACMNHIAAGPVRPRILTVEAEMEYQLPGTTQVLVRPEAGMSFESVLRAGLRSNPDVIMVGEIRDLETLTLSLQAALTGHRVLISLHTSEAATALQRMIDVGASPFTVSDATKLIVAQRLVRSLCPKCSVAGKPAEASSDPAQKLVHLAGLSWDNLAHGFREPVGCKECHLTGYHGRIVIAEAMEVTPRIAAAMARGTVIADWRAIAVSEGMSTLAAEGLRLAAEGKTSLSEVMRMAGAIYGAEPMKNCGN